MEGRGSGADSEERGGEAVYAKILAERLEKEIEEKSIMPENQAGFRSKRGTIDNIYVLNYLVNKNIDKKGGKLVALFVDLKAAFDSVDRGILIKTMRERGIREGLITRVEMVLRETKSRVRVGDETDEEFWTGRGVRQGCPLSPLLFNMLISDLEEVMGRVKWGGVKVRGERVCTLAYADDLVAIADDEDQMRSMLERLEKYLDEKNLVLNAEKSKMMRFRKGGGRESKRSWWWKGNRIEEVKEYCYLGYVLQKNGGQEAQIKGRVRRAAAVMGQIWGIGKRRYGGDWGKRLWLFDRLVWTVMGYGVEIWGWKERDSLERLKERYLRWVMGLDWHTPGYMIREEMLRDKLRGKAGRRAWKYEKRLEEGGGSELARKCLEEIKLRDRSGKEEGIPGYLRKGWGESRWKRIIRCRLGNEMRGSRYWEDEERKKCRLCGNSVETWEHVWEECRDWARVVIEETLVLISRSLEGDGEHSTPVVFEPGDRALRKIRSRELSAKAEYALPSATDLRLRVLDASGTESSRLRQRTLYPNCRVAGFSGLYSVRDRIVRSDREVSQPPPERLFIPARVEDW
ncbi:uncharacterized protein LOC118647508 [Monomorium pharaonis]|uniref:uncharacterized protein LOC118647508 n=1 Tax=Monomorium pharaonis TaxID=307658 RepID=UPI001747430A|nr:uncharacterized protein LOC118647508 [Monomorium pharaonis]